ncbi:MAG: hypothetical protein PF517_22655 [Salinivirgaceae bacterium]|jgi:hypothetical protein|nr:hypothetical protein [Salinivirgaceae bacterium]
MFSIIGQIRKNLSIDMIFTKKTKKAVVIISGGGKGLITIYDEGCYLAKIFLENGINGTVF